MGQREPEQPPATSPVWLQEAGRGLTQQMPSRPLRREGQASRHSSWGQVSTGLLQGGGPEVGTLASAPPFKSR